MQRKKAIKALAGVEDLFGTWLRADRFLPSSEVIKNMFKIYMVGAADVVGSGDVGLVVLGEWGSVRRQT